MQQQISGRIAGAIRRVVWAIYIFIETPFAQRAFRRILDHSSLDDEKSGTTSKVRAFDFLDTFSSSNIERCEHCGFHAT